MLLSPAIFVAALSAFCFQFSEAPLPEIRDDRKTPVAATFSIVAVDRETGEIGVAVQSKIVAVGAVVPYARAGSGAIASQAWANPRFGPLGLLLLETGANPEQCLLFFKTGDQRIEDRQAGIVDAKGNAATFTGSKCSEWAGGKTGEGYAVQGNILAGEEVIDAMANAFEATAEKVLAERLLSALEAGQNAGGDRRGRQSAALLVVREGWGYGGLNDRFRDLRVDEHETPIAELKRVYQMHRKLFPRPEFPKKPKNIQAAPKSEEKKLKTEEKKPEPAK